VVVVKVLMPLKLEDKLLWKICYLNKENEMLMFLERNKLVSLVEEVGLF
jgi:hypothetical protein